MKYLLDTNAWIEWLRQGNPSLVSRIQAANPSDLLLCSVVLAELVYGAERSPPAFRARNLQRVEQLRLRCASLPFDDDAAVIAGQIRSQLATAGTPIGPHDVQIAAIAASQGVTLVTHNVSEFCRVPGLLYEDWEIP